MQHADFVLHCSRSQSRGVPVHNDRRLIMMSISLNCPSDRTSLSVGEQRDSMVSCLGPEGFIRRVDFCLEQDVDHVYQVECDKSVQARTDCSTKSKEVIQAFLRLFYYWAGVYLLSVFFCFFLKIPREKVLFNFLHCFFGSSETSLGTFGLEFKDAVIVLPVFQFTVAKDFYVIYFIQNKILLQALYFFSLPHVLFCSLHLTSISQFYCHAPWRTGLSIALMPRLCSRNNFSGKSVMCVTFCNPFVIFNTMKYL